LLRGRLVDVVARVAENHLQSPDDLGLVVDDEHARVAGAHPTVAGCSTSGKETANAVPSEESACRRSSPPLASTKPLQIARPRPAPSRSSPVWNGLKIASRWDTGTPGPRSTTLIITFPAAVPPLIRTG